MTKDEAKKLVEVATYEREYARKTLIEAEKKFVDAVKALCAVSNAEERAAQKCIPFRLRVVK